MVTRRQVISGLSGAGALALLGSSVANTRVAAANYRACLTPQPLSTSEIISSAIAVGQQPITATTGIAQAPIRLRQMFDRTKAWTSEQLQIVDGKLTLPYAFLDGTPQQKGWVESFANGWLNQTGATRLRLKLEIDPSKALVRIRFTRGAWGAGSSSKVGNDAWLWRQMSDAPTMMLEDLKPTLTDDLARFYVLHEFGHALGLLHEHAYPGAIQWNRQVVLDYYSDNYQWNEDKVQKNVFDVYSDGFICGEASFDPKSVMQYPIPPGHATIRDHPEITQIGYNSALTAADLRCVHAAYV